MAVLMSDYSDTLIGVYANDYNGLFHNGPWTNERWLFACNGITSQYAPVTVLELFDTRVFEANVRIEAASDGVTR